MPAQTNNLNPVVSIIIPTFNRDKFIGAAVESILEQTYQDFEIIIVDDGSTDRTAEVIRLFPADKLIYIYQTNCGRSNARNYALSIARGRYIAFLDSDDLYLPGKLELQVNYMTEHPEVDMIYTSAYCMDENGNSINHHYDAKVSGRIYKDIAFFVPVTITLPTVMVRRKVFDKVGGFDEKMERFEDTDMWRRISKHFFIGAIAESTCKLRTHRDNSLISQDPQKIVKAVDYYASKIFRDDADVGIITLRKGVSTLYQYYGYALLTQSKWASLGRALLYKALACWPLSPRLYVKVIYYHTLYPLKKWLGN